MVAVILLAASAAKTPQERYVDKYAETAVREMYRSGVPASITLAQGLLESRYGLSVLAAEGNNHFGIKCHDWKGRSMRHDDDAKGECFRVYDSADESFRDHSDFLRYRDRYKFLFDYKTTDYKAWAHGLKKAGYATDPAYPSKLIKLIEDYDLARYDRMKVSDFKGAETEVVHVEIEDGQSVPAVKEEARKNVSRKEKKKAEKKEKKRKSHKESEEVVGDEIPEPPLAIEEPKKVEKSGETFTFSLSRQLYSKNGVPFVYSIEGETYASIAESNGLFLKEILKYNDLRETERLLPGTVVYLQPKKKQTAKGLDKYVTDAEGENLRDIAQRFGVKLESIYKMNGFDAGTVLREGDMVVLRK